MIERYGYDGRGITNSNSSGWIEQVFPSLILEGKDVTPPLEQFQNHEHFNCKCVPEQKPTSIPQPTRIIFHDPATIVFWDDETKTVVKCMEGTAFSAYYGFLCALGKKIYGSNRAIEKMVWEGEVQL